MSLRETFDRDAELYDRARPGYPAELFDDLTALAGLGPGERVLEIGCGTGQATVPLAERRLEITCIELGGRLADYAQRKLAPFPNVTVVNSDVETWEPPPAAFDAVVAFTSFHWLDPETRYRTVARLLRADGALAVVGTNHVLPANGDDFFIAVQADYEAVVPELTTKDEVPPPPDRVGGLRDEIDAGGLFRTVGERRYLWDLTYTADEYLDVLRTYSGHIALEAERRDELLERIRHRIEARPGATVRKSYLTTLDVARRVS